MFTSIRTRLIPSSSNASSAASPSLTNRHRWPPLSMIFSTTLRLVWLSSTTRMDKQRVPPTCGPMWSSVSGTDTGPGALEVSGAGAARNLAQTSRAAATSSGVAFDGTQVAEYHLRSADVAERQGSSTSRKDGSFSGSIARTPAASISTAASPRAGWTIRVRPTAVKPASWSATATPLHSIMIASGSRAWTDSRSDCCAPAPTLTKASIPVPANLGDGPVNRPASAIDLEPECRTRAWAAFNPNRAAHHLDVPLADSEAKTCSAEPFGNRTVSLRKFLEHSDLGCRLNADPGINHLETETDAKLPLCDRSHRNEDATPLCELHCVGSQVEQDLADLSLGGLDSQWHAVADMQRQRQTLFAGLNLNEVLHLKEQVRNSKLSNVRRPWIGLHPRQLQDVVNHLQQRTARAHDRPRHVGGLRWQLFLFQQGAHADDGVQRRAQLMADVGEEQAFRLVGHLCLPPRGVQPGEQLIHIER